MTRYTLLGPSLSARGSTREGTHVSMEAFFNLRPAKFQRIGFLAVNLLPAFRDDFRRVIVYFGIDTCPTGGGN